MLDVDGGVVWAEHDAVVGAAWMARGVIDVDDELQITGFQNALMTTSLARRLTSSPPHMAVPGKTMASVVTLS